MGESAISEPEVPAEWTEARLDDPRLFINRELSLLEFHRYAQRPLDLAHECAALAQLAEGLRAHRTDLPRRDLIDALAESA